MYHGAVVPGRGIEKCLEVLKYDEELYLVGCDNNKCKIEEKILERFPESEVIEWVYSSRGKMALMSFKVLFSTMPKI